MSALRLVHMVSSIGHEASGPSYVVTRLCSALAQRGHHVELHVLRWTETTPTVDGVDVRVHELLPFPRKLGISPAMARSLEASARNAHVIHTHGLWMMTNLYTAAAARRTGRPLVTSPHGALAHAALARSRAQKRVMWALGQRRAFLDSALFHAASTIEAADIARFSVHGTSIATIPYGIDVPENADQWRDPHRKRKKVLFLGRVHPIKGVDLLLRAWSRVESKHPEWDLEIVGPPEGDYGTRMHDLARELSLVRVRMLPAVYGAEKLRAYANADLFVLPTHTENFGVSVAEALAMEVPVIVTNGAPWSGVESERCGYWIERTPEALTDALERALGDSDERRKGMGARGRDWMLRDFGWQSIAARMEEAYRALMA